MAGHYWLHRKRVGKLTRGKILSVYYCLPDWGPMLRLTFSPVGACRLPNIRVVLKQNLQRIWAVNQRHIILHCFFFETGSLEGFVVLNYPSISCSASENLLKTCSTLALILICWDLPTRRLLPPYLRRSTPPSRRAFITLHSLALRRPPTALVPCRRPPPPLVLLTQ